MESDKPLPAPFLGIGDITEYTTKVLTALMRTIKASSALPHSGDDFDLYSSFPGFRRFYNQQSSSLTDVINLFLSHQGLKCMPKHEASSIDVDDRYDTIVETNDTILEQVSALLESSSGTSKKVENPRNAGSPIEESQSLTPKPKTVVTSWNRADRFGRQLTFKLFHAQNIVRPQTNFKDKIDNSNVPFVPKISEKPNAIKPLPKALVELNSRSSDADVPLAIANLVRQGREYSVDDQNIYAHQYEAELQALKFSEKQLQRSTPQMYEQFPEKPCDAITAVGDLISVVEHLKSCSEFAVDLEHHSYRSFQGITCLMQVSSRSKDFLIDTLELRSEMHHFNEVFTDPKIVKVFHGADFDIQWLQRDFGVYVVNMFDTGQAARELNLGRYSLDYLLQKYCGVHADKKYQLADWRIRPLPTEMRKYAQEDTHYLLYVYDMMKNDLLDSGVNGQGVENARLLKVLCKSREVCLRTYEKFLLTPTSHLQLYEKRRSKKQLNEKQLELLKLLFIWRDTMARQEDESPGYVLPKHMLFQIAEIMPREAQGILACCNPVPPLVHQHVHTIHQLVLEARVKKTTSQLAAAPTDTPVPARPEVDNYDDILHCHHDLSHYENFSSKKITNWKTPKTSASVQSAFLDTAYLGRIRQLEAQSSAKLRETHWDPFAKYFPVDQTPASRHPIPTKEIKTLDDLTLKTMLQPEYSWRLRNLQGEMHEKLKPKETPKQPETKDDVIILSKVPQPHGQKRQSQTPQEKKMSRLAKKKAKKLANSDFQPYDYQKTQYARFGKGTP